MCARQFPGAGFWDALRRGSVGARKRQTDFIRGSRPAVSGVQRALEAWREAERRLAEATDAEERQRLRCEVETARRSYSWLAGAANHIARSDIEGTRIEAPQEPHGLHEREGR